VRQPGLGVTGAELPDGFAGDRAGFLLAELVPLAAVLAVAAVLARGGRRRDHAGTAAETELIAA